MPHEVRATPQGAFAKACWLDCMARLARRLSSARLQDSEFRWIEGDAGGRARRSSFPLGQVPPDMAAGRHADFRDAFMTLSRWVPDYFETRAGFRPLRSETKPIASADEWAVAAWAASHRSSRRLEAGPSTSLGAGQVEGFSFVHVMVFHPPIDDPRGAAAEGAARLGRLRAGLRLGYRRRRHVSVTYVPGKLDWAATRGRGTSAPIRIPIARSRRRHPTTARHSRVPCSRRGSIVSPRISGMAEVASERSEASHANGASRRSGSRESV